MTLRETADLLETCDYPLDAETLAAAHGEFVLDHPNGAETLGEVLDRTGEDRFESAEDARQAIYGSVGAEAVGRVGYSDRDPTPMGVDGPEPVSF